MPSASDVIAALTQTWPARMAKGAWEAAKLPGDVLFGRAVLPSQGGIAGSAPPGTPGTDESFGRMVDLAGTVMGGSYAAPAMQGGAGMGIRAYHGSPHDFDRFDMSKIGTGEGTQMEGKGLYFGGHPKVADFYYDTTVKEFLAREAKNAQPLHPQQQRQLVDQISGIIDSEGIKAIDEYTPPHGFERAWDAMVSAVKKTGGTKGVRYEVNINAKPDEFYDLGRPLSEQKEGIRDAMNRVWRNPEFTSGQTLADDAKGYQLRPILNNLDAVSELARLGVPGSKYLDEGSRQLSIVRPSYTGEQWRVADRGGRIAAKFKTEGEAQKWLENNTTSNYVLFRDDIIEILRKYGIAGLGVIGYDQIASEQQQ